MKFSRRQFVTHSTGIVAAGALVQALSSKAQSEERRRGRGGEEKSAAGAAGLALPLVNPSSDAAKAVNYVKVHGDFKNAALKTERQGVAWDQQFCSGCSFYKEVGSKEGSKVGTCTIFPNQLVLEKAWCSSWNKKT